MVYAEYAASLIAGDADRWAAQWTDDGVQLPSNAPMNVGLDEIRRSLGALLEEVKFVRFETSTQEVQLVGPDLAFARGVYTYFAEQKQGGDPISWDGKYLTMFRRQPDGSWKIYRDVYNSNLP